MSLISRYRGFAMFCWICHSLVVMVYCPDSMSGIGGVGCRVIKCRVFKTMTLETMPQDNDINTEALTTPGTQDLSTEALTTPGTQDLSTEALTTPGTQDLSTEALTTPRLLQRHQQHSATRLAPKAYTKAHRRLSSTSFCFSIVSVCKMRPHFAK